MEMFRIVAREEINNQILGGLKDLMTVTDTKSQSMVASSVCMCEKYSPLRFLIVISLTMKHDFK